MNRPAPSGPLSSLKPAVSKPARSFSTCLFCAAVTSWWIDFRTDEGMLQSATSASSTGGHQRALPIQCRELPWMILRMWTSVGSWLHRIPSHRNPARCSCPELQHPATNVFLPFPSILAPKNSEEWQRRSPLKSEMPGIWEGKFFSPE
jgi:hypothetical protein